MKAFVLQKHRRKVIAIALSSIVLACVCRYYVLNSAAKSDEIEDIDLFGKFCAQHEAWQSHYYPIQVDARKQPQWIPDKTSSSNVLLTEKDRSSHLFKNSVQPDVFMDQDVWDGLPVKGAFYMIVRNEQLEQAKSSMRSVEDRFNSYNASYPWVILNSQHFTVDFKRSVRSIASGKVYFGQIDLQAWTFPEWIDSKRTENAIRRMIYLGVKKSHSLYQRQEMRYV